MFNNFIMKNNSFSFYFNMTTKNKLSKIIVTTKFE